MHPVTTAAVSLVAIAVLAAFIILMKKGHKTIALTALLVAALAVGGYAVYQQTRPYVAWIAHPDPDSSTDPRFVLPKGKGVYQGSSDVFNTPLDKQEVFAEFKVQFPDAEFTDNRAYVTINGEVLELVYAPEPDSFDYTLQYVQ